LNSPLAILFPGQGSQIIGMGKSFFEGSNAAKQTFEEASETLGFSVESLCFEGPEDKLVLTENTQPALLTVSTAIIRAIQESGLPLSVRCTLGHSLGEYSSLVFAGSLGFSDALKAVRLRGLAMQRAVPVGEGSMLAVLKVEDADVVKLCQWASLESGVGSMEPANFNAPGQVVVSGSKQAIDWVTKNWSQEACPLSSKPRFIELKVSAPFHSSLMAPAQREMAEFLRSVAFENAKIPVIQNVTAKATQDSYEIKRNIIDQITGSVKWTASVKAALALDVRAAIEVGPSKVLTGLWKKIDSDERPTLNIENLSDLGKLEGLV